MNISILWFSVFAAAASAFLSSSNSNVAVYWGQNSAGGKSTQSRLADYCSDTSADIILLSFLHVYYGTGDLPEINFSSACDDGSAFSGTALVSCPTIAEDIVTCQKQGKIILLSLGGASGTYGFDSSSQGTKFADTLWNLFMGGTSETRPFGSAVIDGIDLDIEGGSDVGYTEFVTRLREHFDGASKSYYISAAPQCVIPDTYLNTVITSAEIDFLFVQFYNNYCGMQAWQAGDSNPIFNYAAWDTLVKSSPNPNAKIYLGTLASESAGGSGYVKVDTVLQAANYLQSNYNSFGGIMTWDASQAWTNIDSTTGLNFAAACKAGLSGSTTLGSALSSKSASASSEEETSTTLLTETSAVLSSISSASTDYSSISVMSSVSVADLSSDIDQILSTSAADSLYLATSSLFLSTSSISSLAASSTLISSLTISLTSSSTLAISPETTDDGSPLDSSTLLEESTTIDISSISPTSIYPSVTIPTSTSMSSSEQNAEFLSSETSTEKAVTTLGVEVVSSLATDTSLIYNIITASTTAAAATTTTGLDVAAADDTISDAIVAVANTATLECELHILHFLQLLTRFFFSSFNCNRCHIFSY